MSRYLYFPTRKKLELLYKTNPSKSSRTLPFLNPASPANPRLHACYCFSNSVTRCSPKYKVTPHTRQRGQSQTSPDFDLLTATLEIQGVLSRDQSQVIGPGPDTWHTITPGDTLADNFIETNCSQINFNVLHLFLPQSKEDQQLAKKVQLGEKQGGRERTVKSSRGSFSLWR